MAKELRVYRRSELEAIKPAMDADGCLLRYKAIWLDGVDDTSDPALIGIAFASIKHAYILKLLDAKLGQDYELAEDAFVGGIAAAQTPSRLVPEVHDLWKFHAEKFELSLERFVAAEERGSAGDVGFTPDLVQAHPETNTLEIIDDKAGWHPPMTEAELKLLFQARVYSRYAMDRWPHFDGYTFTLNAVRFNVAVSVTFTPQELENVELEVRAAIATIEEARTLNHWPATPGPACHFCTLACPVADQVVTLPKRLMQEQMAKLGTWLLVAEKQLRAAKKLMKTAVGVYGPTTINGMVWANSPVSYRSYPIDVLMEVLRLRGAMGAFEDAAGQGLTISHSGLSKLFAAYPGLEDDLKGVVKTKTSYRFGAKSTAVLLEAGEEEAE